ncbi:MAG: TAXI family TRAP transporter solute-binding subunit [Lachnospiraceae bacterium]|nr:TAXI family TRAP transporter solute-binding subunit [Lachnospiraceae bacterium]
MNIKNKKLQIYAAGVLTLTAVLSGCSEKSASQGAVAEPMAYEAGTLIMGTGEEGVQIHRAGKAIAEVINNTVPGIHVAVETTKGTAINAVNVSEGDLDLALVNGDVAYDAVNGVYAFEGEALENLRVLGACYQEVSGWMALKKTELTHVNQLTGKIISSGPIASATELASDMVFKILGIDQNNTEIYSDSLTNSVKHIKRETADAVHAFATVPYRAHEELASEYESVVLGYTEEELEQILEMDDRYFKTVIPAGTYAGQDEEIPTFGMKVLLCASAEMDEDLAYEIARALDLNGPAYTGEHRFMAAIQEKEFLCNDLPITLHEGAKRYYQEVGFLKD